MSRPYNREVPRAFIFLASCYLALAGTIFLLAPWSSHWLSVAWSLPPPWARFFSHPALRGAISGFGLLHFIVGLSWRAESRSRS
jgi:hypothetical protein